MKSSIIFSALSLLSLQQFANALPAKRDALSDADVLNFALTLEHLEAAFYRQSLPKFSKRDFMAHDFPEWTRGRFQQIAAHEKSHVEFLSSALLAAGAQPVQPCEYDFPVTDPKSFVSLAMTFEHVGTSAYNGAAAYIASKPYLTVAASILAVEARHDAWINSAAQKSNPWSTAFETPLSFNQVYTLASGFIKSCPAANPVLPVKAFPQLTAPTKAQSGKLITLKFDVPEDNKPLFAAFITGTGTVFAPINSGRAVEIPQGLIGGVYVIVTNDGGEVSDDTTVAGPALIILPFDSNDRILWRK